MSTEPDLPQMTVERFRATHKASVVAILGRDAPPVYSRGSRFYNVDRWTIRILVSKMCDWAKANPGCMPTRTDVAGWVHAANAERVSPRDRKIVIAATPSKLTQRVAMALVGGGYHEAFHTRYSCRRDLTVDEIARIVLPRWAKVPDWSKLVKLLQDWNNVIEDIRIERRGGEDYPGIHVKMCDLQDFILAQEAADREAMLASGNKDKIGRALAMVMGAFRDIGLGYETARQADALDLYRKLNPAAVDMVETGPLKPLVDESINLSATDDTGCLRLAMDVVAEIAHLADPEDLQQAQQGAGGKPQCPKCGAPGKCLVVRPLSDGKGGKVKGKGVITCTKCGWQEIVDLQVSKAPPQKAPPQDNDDAIQFEDIPQDAPDSGEGDADGDEPGEDDPKPSKGKGEAEDEESDEDGSGGSASEDEGEEEESEPSKGKGAGSSDADAGDEDGDESEDGEEAEGSDEGDEEAEGSDEGDEEAGDGADPGDEGEESDEDADNDDASGAPSQGDDSTDSDSDEAANGAGGHLWDEDRAEAWEYVADDILEDAAKGGDAGLRDGASALEEAFEQVREKEDADCEPNERPWRPYSTNYDVIQMVQPSAAGLADDRVRADKLLASVKSECSYLRARLRAIVRAVEQRQIIHGVRRGKEISERMLVDSVAAIRSGRAPTRAYYTESDKIDTSVAAVIVIDQSSSMEWPRTKLQDATRCMMAITEPLDALGAAVMAAGFRDGPGIPHDGGDDTRECHRTEGVCYDIFKGFNERFATVKWRFANTRATGGTPMADGVQLGLDVLEKRPEGHRLLFIVTDGDPNYLHDQVIRRQIRLATEAGIRVIGVGIGNDCKNVMRLFDDHVWSPSVREMPQMLISKLNEILDFRGLKRGRTIRKSA